MCFNLIICFPSLIGSPVQACSRHLDSGEKCKQKENKNERKKQEIPRPSLPSLPAFFCLLFPVRLFCNYQSAWNRLPWPYTKFNIDNHPYYPYYMQALIFYDVDVAVKFYFQLIFIFNWVIFFNWLIFIFN